MTEHSPASNHSDVAIIGGGVAGYAAAITLAMAGRSVAVLDKDLSGPDRLGESLDWETPRMLDTLGISIDTLVEADQATFKRGAVATHATLPGRLGIGFHVIYRVLMGLVGRNRPSYHVERASMSEALRNRAISLGVELIETRVASVDSDGDRIMAVVDQNNTTFTATQFIDATGRARLLTRHFGIEVTPVGPAKIALSARMKHPYDEMGTRIRLDDSRDHATWIWDINTGVNQTDVGTVLAAKDVAAELRSGTSVLELYRTELARHPDLSWALEQSCDSSEVHRTAFQDQVSNRMVGDNWVLAGEAAAVIDPLLSSGMSFSFRSGISAGEVVLARSTPLANSGWPAKRHDMLLRSYALTVNTLLDELWYRSQLRFVRGFAMNVLLLLGCNFNLNHLQSRRLVNTRVGAPALVAFHTCVRRIVPKIFRGLESLHVPVRNRRKPTEDKTP